MRNRSVPFRSNMRSLRDADGDERCWDGTRLASRYSSEAPTSISAGRYIGGEDALSKSGLCGRCRSAAIGLYLYKGTAVEYERDPGGECVSGGVSS